jgi:hypothetical protein
MKNLRELALLVSKVKLKASDLVTTDASSRSMVQEYFQMIQDGKFEDDAEASQYFFEEDPNFQNYKNLKRNLRKKMLSSIFFMDPQKAKSDYERAFLFCSKYMAAAKILLHLQAKDSGVRLCQKVFSKALEFELTEFIVDAAKYLRLHYGTRIGDADHFQYYNTIFKRFSKLNDSESLAQEYYAKLMLPNIQSKANNLTISEQAQIYHTELQPALDQYTSPFLHFIGKYIQVIAAMGRNQYAQTIALCDEAIAFFEEKPFTYNAPLRVFLHNQLICYTQLKDYTNGKRAAQKSIQLVRKGTYNWYVNKELQVVLAFHAKEYQEAARIFFEAVNFYKHSSMPAVVQERWRIIEAYIYFLVEIGLIEPLPKMSKFRLGKFLNSIPTYSKDKRGLNIPILIIQILFMIAKKDYDQAIDRSESIKKYSSRYLRKGETFRSNCFINMLLQVPASSFHSVGVERKAKKYADKLKEQPLEIANQNHEVELIPYEDLWQIVLSQLGKKFHVASR